MRHPLRAVVPVALLFGLGCQFGLPETKAPEDTALDTDPGRDSSANEDTEETDLPEPKDPTFEVVWGEDSVTIGIVGAMPSAHFDIGLAQTDQCAQGCWTGEDCLYGQEPWSWCHPSGSEGVTLAYGADPNTLVEGEQTVFTHPNFAYVTTYMITRERDGACWAFGHDPSYFAAAGCKTF